MGFVNHTWPDRNPIGRGRERGEELRLQSLAHCDSYFLPLELRPTFSWHSAVCLFANRKKNSRRETSFDFMLDFAADADCTNVDPLRSFVPNFVWPPSSIRRVCVCVFLAKWSNMVLLFLCFILLLHYLSHKRRGRKESICLWNGFLIDRDQYGCSSAEVIVGQSISRWLELRTRVSLRLPSAPWLLLGAQWTLRMLLSIYPSCNNPCLLHAGSY